MVDTSAKRTRVQTSRFQVTHSKKNVAETKSDVVRARPIFKRFSDLHPTASRNLVAGTINEPDVAKFMQYIDSVYKP